MACYRPLYGYKAQSPNPSGKRNIVFNVSQGYRDMPVTLPCGSCIGCRLERSRQWAIRCLNEASLHSENSFITLTYSEENLPKYGSLQKEDFQKFMKRLRFEYADKKIRYFHCGEYGENTYRPHYHACIFGHDFSDKQLWKTVRGNKYFRSDTLERLWPMGQSTIGEVTFESAAYVARYITKKITGPLAEMYYTQENELTGDIEQKLPEYVTMSRRPGIGKNWLEKYSKDIFPDDFIIVRGKKMRPPKYYRSQYELADPKGYAEVRAANQVAAAKKSDNNTWDRLIVRETIQIEKFRRLKRSYEDE